MTLRLRELQHCAKLFHELGTFATQVPALVSNCFRVPKLPNVRHDHKYRIYMQCQYYLMNVGNDVLGSFILALPQYRSFRSPQLRKRHIFIA